MPACSCQWDPVLASTPACQALLDQIIAARRRGDRTTLASLRSAIESCGLAAAFPPSDFEVPKPKRAGESFTPARPGLTPTKTKEKQKMPKQFDAAVSELKELMKIAKTKEDIDAVRGALKSLGVDPDEAEEPEDAEPVTETERRRAVASMSVEAIMGLESLKPGERAAVVRAHVLAHRAIEAARIATRDRAEAEILTKDERTALATVRGSAREVDTYDQILADRRRNVGRAARVAQANRSRQ